MKLLSIIRWLVLIVPLAIGFGGSVVKSADTNLSGIVEYVYEPNPQEIKPKMYNWQIKLNQTDSRNGPYEIVQVTKSSKADPKPKIPKPTVLIDSNMIVPNRDGIIDFNLYVGDKEPKQNMGRRGNIGQPIIFSGKGTGKGESNWIVLSGTKIDRVAPSAKGTQLLHGRLNLLELIVTNDSGEKFQVDVMLRRK